MNKFKCDKCAMTMEAETNPGTCSKCQGEMKPMTEDGANESGTASTESAPDNQ